MQNTLPYIYLDGGLQSIQTTRLTSTGCRNTLPYIYLDGGLQSIQTTRLTSTGCRTLCHISTWMVAYSPYRPPGLPRPDVEHFAIYLLGWWLTVHTDHQAYLDRMQNTLPYIYLDGGLQSIQTTRLTSTGCRTLCNISTWMVAYSPYRPPGLPRPDVEHFAIYLLDGGLQSIQTTRLTSTGCRTLCHISTWMVAYSPYRPPGLPRPDAEHFAIYLLGWWLTVHTDHQAYLDRMWNTLPYIYLDGGLQSIQTTRLTSTGCRTLCHISTWMVAYSPYRPPGLPRPDVEHFAIYLLGWWLTVHTDHQAYLDRMRNTKGTLSGGRWPSKHLTLMRSTDLHQQTKTQTDCRGRVGHDD